jgi:hypothetical protein
MYCSVTCTLSFELRHESKWKEDAAHQGWQVEQPFITNCDGLVMTVINAGGQMQKAHAATQHAACDNQTCLAGTTLRFY